ncbi:MAG TPA: hypothetical protein VNM69_00520 [Bacillus sp. (in: firmicutes)]|uniref:hypothetical protein n=1 Tax=Bacillus litorisediminis TaxID=2922713 RepID=UPI001FAE8DA6|nr:hypothetical protein [Bacillus litorisediminis]HWO74379.1 hypothetical protein [Bacillus sp. (in: firmicutes)]
MAKINVIDSIMGSGKTSWAIQYMNEAPDTERFIYITPLLDEVDRIEDKVKDRMFVQPDNKKGEGSKLRHLKDLLSQGVDIASTHALFRAADDEVEELLTDGGYTLILDEVMSCVEPVNLRKGDLPRLQRARDIEIDPTTKRVIWIGDPDDNSRYTDIRLIAQAGNLYCYRDTLLVWAFPPNVFCAFDKVIIMTYLFRGQEQRYYLDMFGFDYEYNAISCVDGRYLLVEYDPKNEGREELYRLINVYQGKKNNIGYRQNALSATQLRKRAEASDKAFFKRVQDNLYGFFKNDAKAKRDDVYYSTLKEVEDKIQPRGYKEPRKRANQRQEDKRPQVVLPINVRATNRYADRWALAYVFNRYMHQNVKAFFQDQGVSVEDDLLAVSDLLQWIYRSRIRNGEPIELYLPSSRMRGLLEAWAKYEI